MMAAFQYISHTPHQAHQQELVNFDIMQLLLMLLTTPVAFSAMT